MNAAIAPAFTVQTNISSKPYSCQLFSWQRSDVQTHNKNVGISIPRHLDMLAWMWEIRKSASGEFEALCAGLQGPLQMHNVTDVVRYASRELTCDEPSLQ